MSDMCAVYNDQHIQMTKKINKNNNNYIYLSLSLSPLALLNLCLNADLLWCVHGDKYPWASGLSDSIQALEGSIVSVQSTSLWAVMSVMSVSSVKFFVLSSSL